MRTIWILDYANDGISCAYESEKDAIDEARRRYLEWAEKRLDVDKNWITAADVVDDIRNLENNGWIEDFVYITEIVLEPDSRTVLERF